MSKMFLINLVFFCFILSNITFGQNLVPENKELTSNLKSNIPIKNNKDVICGQFESNKKLLHIGSHINGKFSTYDGHWDSEEIHFKYQTTRQPSRISTSQVENAIITATGLWNNVLGRNIFYYDGTTIENVYINDNKNTIYWDNQTIGETIAVTDHNSTNGVITGADIKFNPF